MRKVCNMSLAGPPELAATDRQLQWRGAIQGADTIEVRCVTHKWLPRRPSLHTSTVPTICT